MSEHAADIDRRIRLFLLVGLSLLVLTGVTVGVFFIHLPKTTAIIVALVIATFKASMVAAVFMHLIDERKLIYSTLLVTVVFFVVLLLAPVLTAHDPVTETEVENPVPSAPSAQHGAEH